jgi:hypothetical protein
LQPVPNPREHLIHLLTEAAEVEHNILCSYLYAVFSMKVGPEEGLTEYEAQVVDRWRGCSEEWLWRKWATLR